MTTGDRADRQATLPPVKRAYSDEELEGLPPELRDWLAWTPDGCLVWLGRRRKDGYGQVTRKVPGLDQLTTAHGVVWRLLRGHPPDGMVLGHTCHDDALARGLCKGGPRCVHRVCVVHVELQTIEENAGRTFWALKTHCVNGHELSGNNLGYRDGWRFCKTCQREGTRRSLARPHIRKKRRRYLREYHKKRMANDPEYRDRVNERVRAYWADPEVKERVRERAHERYATEPEYREKNNDHSRQYQSKRWAEDPDWRERRNAYVGEWKRERRKDPEFRKRETLQQQLRREDPAHREQRNSRAREYKRRRRQDPDFREKERQYQREYHARKRAEAADD